MNATAIIRQQGGRPAQSLTVRSYEVRHSCIRDHSVVIATVCNCRSDSSDNDNNGGKYPANSVDLFLVLRVTRLVQL